MSDVELKQVIVLRNDLNMRKGKMVAQGSHASVFAVLPQFIYGVKADESLTRLRSLAVSWFEQGMKKICVRADSEVELLELHERAVAANLLSCPVTDAGHTEFHGQPTLTALAIGPAPASEIDKITGHLKPL